MSSLVHEFHNAFATNVKPKVEILKKTFASVPEQAFFLAACGNFGRFVLEK